MNSLRRPGALLAPEGTVNREKSENAAKGQATIVSSQGRHEEFRAVPMPQTMHSHAELGARPALP